MTATQHDAVLTWNEPSPVPLRGTLVVLAGRGESPLVYERFGRRLAADAYRVHVLAAPTDTDGAAGEQLHSVLAAAPETTPRIVVGSDAGAAYAAYLAANSQLAGVSALILAGLPTTSLANPVVDWEQELDIRTSCPTHRGRISEAVRRAELFTDLSQEWFDPSIGPRIELPVLGIHGREDPLSPLEAARRWYQTVPRAELVSIVGGRHDALNDQTHRTVAATIVLFLERLRLAADLAPIAVTEPLRQGQRP